jgi:hypothetical protein
MTETPPFFWFCALAGLTQFVLHGVLLDPLSVWDKGIPAFGLTLYLGLGGAIWILFGAAIVFAYLWKEMRPVAWWHWIALSPMPMLGFIVITGTPAPLAAQVYLVLSAVAWLIFIWDGKVATPYFLIWIAVCVTLILTLDQPWFSLGTFVAITLTGRLIRTFLTENYEVFHKLTLGELVTLTGRTAIFFVPIAAVAIGWNIWFSSFVQSKVEEGLYVRYQNLRNACQPKAVESLRERFSCLIDTEHAKQKKEMDDAIAQVPRATDAALEDVERNMMAGFDKAFPATINLGAPESCHSVKLNAWAKSPCDYQRDALIAVQNAYKDERARQLAGLKERLQEARTKANGSALTFATDASGILSEYAEKLRVAEQSALSNAFFVIDAANVITNLMLLLAASRGFMMIFSRVCFSNRPNVVVQLPSQVGTPPGVAARVTDENYEYTLKLVKDRPVYTAMKQPVDGRADDISIPKWNESPISRIINGTYICNANELEQKNRASITFRTTEGSHFVRWEIAPDEEVVFDPKALVGFEEGVHFRTIASLRLSTLVLGRIFFCCASRGGAIILKTRGTPEIGNTKATRQDVRVTQLVAWQQGAYFMVKSNVDFRNIYFGGVSVAKDAKSHAVIDVPPVISTTRRIARVFRCFLLPV